jgi:hypothetical protein
VFLFGAAVLLVHDGLEWLRFAVACWQLLTGILAGRIVWRLTRSRAATILTPAAVVLTPWAVHERGSLTPEMVALPLLVGLVLARRPWAVGLLCGTLPLIKVPFLLPAVAIIAFGESRGRLRTGLWALATLSVGLAVTSALAGTAFWRDVFEAQTQSGYKSFHGLIGFWAQAGWNLLGLLVPAVLAIRWRHHAKDAGLLRSVLVLAIAMLLTFLTNVKDGTSLNITVPVEAALVPLAACGLVWSARARSERSAPARRLSAQLIALASILFVLAQSLSVIVSPSNPRPFLRVFSAPAWGATLTASQFDAAVVRVRACPPGLPYDGEPLLAFAAHRQMPGDQPDRFLVPRAPVLRSVEARVQAALRRPYCPPVTRFG